MDGQTFSNRLHFEFCAAPIGIGLHHFERNLPARFTNAGLAKLQVCFGFVQLCGELTAGEDGLADADGSNAITADIAWVSAVFFDAFITQLWCGVPLVLRCFNATLR